jgi:hypothetical protein
MNSFGLRPGVSRSKTVSLSIVITLLLSCIAFAQAPKVTLTPASVDPDNPARVVVGVLKADGNPDANTISKIKGITVDGNAVTPQPSDGNSLTFQPPKLITTGVKVVLLLDSLNKELARAELEYRGAGAISEAGTATRIDDQIRLQEQLRRDKLAGSDWYYFLISMMFLFVLGPFVLAIYRGTSGSVATHQRPLGLPVGSFRSILAYSLVAYLGFYVLTSILSVSTFLPPDFLLGIVATVIGFYFGSRSSDDGESSAKTATVRGIVRQGTSPARGAFVKFKRSADGVEPYSRIADVDGRFELTGAAPGKYTVQASLTGSAPSDAQEITLSEGSDHEIEIIIGSASAPPAPKPPAPAPPQPPAPPSPAQGGTVQGTVTKPDDSPAPAATVVLSQAGTEKFKTTTDTAGHYKSDAVPPGDYQLQASLVPFGPSDAESVKVSPAVAQTVNAKLKAT